MLPLSPTCLEGSHLPRSLPRSCFGGMSFSPTARVVHPLVTSVPDKSGAFACSGPPFPLPFHPPDRRCLSFGQEIKQELLPLLRSRPNFHRVIQSAMNRAGLYAAPPLRVLFSSRYGGAFPPHDAGLSGGLPLFLPSFRPPSFSSRIPKDSLSPSLGFFPRHRWII